MIEVPYKNPSPLPHSLAYQNTLLSFVTYQYFAIEAWTESRPWSLCCLIQLSVNARLTQISVFNSAKLCWMVCRQMGEKDCKLCELSQNDKIETESVIVALYHLQVCQCLSKCFTFTHILSCCLEHKFTGCLSHNSNEETFLG